MSLLPIIINILIIFRGLFIIDNKGVLRQITMNDLPVGRSVDETLRLVQAFQYTDMHGEVCPANWKPGEQTVKLKKKKFSLPFILTIFLYLYFIYKKQLENDFLIILF